MPYSLVPHPSNGTHIFGHIETAKVRGITIPPGAIYLRRGIDRKFGLRHIWWKHAADLIRAGFLDETKVPAYVAAIVRPGSPVHFEGGRPDARTRVTIIRSSKGIAVLEFDEAPDCGFYHVITAFGKRNADGTRVGTVR